MYSTALHWLAAYTLSMVICMISSMLFALSNALLMEFRLSARFSRIEDRMAACLTLAVNALVSMDIKSRMPNVTG